MTKTLLPSHLLAWEKLNWAAVFSTERGNLPKEVCACSESKAWANAVKSVKRVTMGQTSSRLGSVGRKRVIV